MVSEAPLLVDQFPKNVGTIARLLYSRPDWDAPEGGESVHRIRASRGDVKVGSFPRDDTHLMVLTLRSRAELRLLVIPPDTDADTADRLMHEALDDHNRRGAGELLIWSDTSTHGSGNTPLEHWDDDGGYSP